MAHEEQVSIRLPTDLVQRAEALVTKMAQDTEYQAWRISRTSVLRLALIHGLEGLEQRYTKAKRR